MNSMSILGKNNIDSTFGRINSNEYKKNSAIDHDKLESYEKLKGIEGFGLDYMKSFNRRASIDRGAGAINPNIKGIIYPQDWMSRSLTTARGVRERFFNLSFRILREAAHRVYPIGAIQNIRCMQLKPFTKRAYNEKEQGLKCRLADRDATPNKKDKVIMKQIEDFFLNSGFTDFSGAEDREDKLCDIIELATREVMTIDQLAFSLRRDKKGRLLDFWVLDGVTIKRTLPDVGYEGDKKIKFVQEIDGRVVEVFTKDDLLFDYMNKRVEIDKRGWGYSYLEMCIDAITAWLFAMAYNKEIFNSGSQPKGFFSFDSDVDQPDLEELQREWVAMFRGVKGMWRTPFLKHGAKWNSIISSNRDMEFNEYVQVLCSWICAIHGIDPAELGIRFNRTQSVMYDNPESKIVYSKDRGLRDILGFHQGWINKIKDMVPEWDPYYVEFVGIEGINQKAELEIDEKQTSVYMTINEKRKEKDLKPIEGGDIINSQVFLQGKQMDAMKEQGFGEENEGQFEEQSQELTDEKFDEKEFKSKKNVNEDMLKSKGEYIEIVID